MGKPTKEIRRERQAGGRDEIWRYVRKSTSEFTIADLRSEVRVEPRTAHDYLNRLVTAGVVSVRKVKVPIGKFPPNRPVTNVYTLETDLGTATPVISADGTISSRQPGSGQQAIWRAMRVLKRFELISVQASLDGTRYSTSLRTIEHYARILRRAGYLRVVRRGIAPGVFNLYQMIRDTGPLAPSVTGAVEAVYDNNQKRVVWNRDDEGADA